MARPIDAATIKRLRTQLVGDADLAGRSLARRLSQQADSWFESLASDLPSGWALMATGGYAGGVLCPGSDIDVVLLHPNKANDAQVRTVAEGLWYPFWDGGIKLSPAVHTTKTLLNLASDDLESATTILRVRCLAGDAELVRRLQHDALEQWRRRPMVWLQRLHESAQLRWERLGDVASLLEPDLKDGRGGLRDHDMIRWALAIDRPDVSSALEGPFEDLAGSAEVLLATRCELHRATGRFVNILLLQDQDRVAEAMGYFDADALMFEVSSAAHSIEWATERFWRRVDRLVKRSGKSSLKQLPEHVAGVTVVDDEAQITADADVDEQSFVFRMAAAAAHAGYPISARSLRMMASRGSEPGEVWAERTRRAFLSLLGAGQPMVHAIEALERYDLFSRYLPEWRAVRSRPQRNAFHTYTVDRHLLQTVANASELMRGVSRPDLLLVGALLHDIGKGYPGDHTEAGIELVDSIGARMGFPPEDVAIIRALIEHHLLLSETATRRDISDPRTAANVAAAVGDPVTLELLVALTEADSRATGPAAWSSWKATLIEELVHAVSMSLRGEHRAIDGTPLDSRFSHLVDQVQAGGGVLIEHESVGDFEMLRIASADRRGLFSLIAGTLALHGLDIVGAEAFTGADGTAVDEFRILRAAGTSPNWSKIAHDLRGVLAGDVDIDARLEQRIKSQGRSRRAVSAIPPRFEVLISNEASDSTTIIDVRAPDAPATLYRLSHALAGAGYDIRSAKVATLGHEVVDVFYVVGADGKLPEDTHADVRACLTSALV
ncbi:MAG: [protein-PII] uridylyltransferase [Actinobacteria bacterium]|nr:[protein-PII] uridylyltransferase [Actinomycetota bacterium]